MLTWNLIILLFSSNHGDFAVSSYREKKEQTANCSWTAHKTSDTKQLSKEYCEYLVWAGSLLISSGW